MNGREMFLHGPPSNWLDGLSEALKERVEAAEDAIAPIRTREWHQPELIRLTQLEARASSHIEGEYDSRRIGRHALALQEFLHRPTGEGALLEMHQKMMHGQPHAQPGQYRTMQVRVGIHHPPPPGLVPSLMEEMFRDIAGRTPSIPLAVWTHVRFETIHPFADGNGRTGRAIMQALLGAPVTVSRFIIREQHTYYELFGRSDWPAWLEWLCRGIMEESDEECERIR